MTMTLERFELADRGDVMRLVNVFYDRVQADELLGPIFNDIAHVDWAAHLPLMYDFWDSVLFSAGTFHGNPLVVHRARSDDAARQPGVRALADAVSRHDR